MSADWSSAATTAPTVSGPIAWPPSTSSTSSSTTARASATRASSPVSVNRLPRSEIEQPSRARRLSSTPSPTPASSSATSLGTVRTSSMRPSVGRGVAVPRPDPGSVEGRGRGRVARHCEGPFQLLGRRPLGQRRERAEPPERGFLRLEPVGCRLAADPLAEDVELVDVRGPAEAATEIPVEDAERAHGADLESGLLADLLLDRTRVGVADVPPARAQTPRVRGDLP